jgi:hypothetical protein
MAIPRRGPTWLLARCDSGFIETAARNHCRRHSIFREPASNMGWFWKVLQRVEIHIKQRFLADDPALRIELPEHIVQLRFVSPLV